MQEFWVVGGRYRDTSFTDLEDGAAEAYGPFARYDEALRAWSSHSSRTRAYASVRYSVVTAVKAHAAAAMAGTASAPNPA